MPISNKPPWRGSNRVSAVAMSAPAVRMVCIRAWAWEEDGEIKSESEVLPVLAIQSRVVDFYTKQSQAVFPEEALSDKGMRDLGWIYRGREVTQHALVLDVEYGLVVADDETLACDNTAYGLKICPWPVEEAARGTGEAAAALRWLGLSTEQLQQAARNPKGFLEPLPNGSLRSATRGNGPK